MTLNYDELRNTKKAIQRKKPVSFRCLGCGQWFETYYFNKRKVCSRECAGKYNRRQKSKKEVDPLYFS